jgi:hypothetical protein
MTFIVTIPDSCRAERNYILHIMLKEFLGLEFIVKTAQRENVCISDNDSRPRLLIADALFATPEKYWLTKESLPKQPLAMFDMENICPENGIKKLPAVPVIYGVRHARHTKANGRNGEEIWLPIDVFGSCFYMLTQYEEIVDPDRDEHDRFPARKTLAWQEGFLQRPIVNEYLEILWTCLKRLWPGITRKKREYRLLLSHDVDEISSVVQKPLKQIIRRIGGDAMVRRDALLVLRSVRAAWRGLVEEDPVNTFDLIMDQSDKLGVISTFNFMTTIGTSIYDKRYNIDHPWARTCIRRIIDRGHLVGFHPTYESYQNAERIKNEFNALKRAVKEEGAEQNEWGGRQHYLRWHNPSTWQYWENAGLTYDSTVGFADHIGFRAGCCYEYPVFNLKKKKQLKLRERPLIVMEGSILNNDGTFKSEDEERIFQLNLTCKQFRGDFCMLWHNGNLISREQKKSYISILAEL